MAIWNRIINWFRDLSERDRLINDFNISARAEMLKSFINRSLSDKSRNQFIILFQIAIMRDFTKIALLFPIRN